MIGTKIQEYTTGEKRRRVAIVLLLLLALLGIGIGGFPGDEQPQPVTVTAEEQNDDPLQTPGSDGTPEGPTGGSSDDQDGSSGDQESQSSTGGDDGGTGEAAETGSITTSSQNDGSNTQQSPSQTRLDITVSKNEMTGQVDNVMPGDSGTVTLNVTNDGNETGEFRVYTSNVTDYENGLTEPEAEVDPDGGGDPGRGEGELSSSLEVRWSLTNSTGDQVYLTDDYVSLADLNNTQIEGGAIPENESAEALFEWRVPTATGNEIQGDAVEFDVDFTLVST